MRRHFFGCFGRNPWEWQHLSICVGLYIEGDKYTQPVHNRATKGGVALTGAHNRIISCAGLVVIHASFGWAIFGWEHRGDESIHLTCTQDNDSVPGICGVDSPNVLYPVHRGAP